MKIDKACKKVIISEEKIMATCKSLGERISKDYEGEEVTMVGLLNGCNPFFSDLIKYIDLEVVVDYIKASSYHGTTKSSSTLYTIKKIMEIFKVKGAKSVEACVLLYKETGDETRYNAKYVGLTIPNEFVIGYGLDYQEHYRNLPYIGVINDELVKGEDN